MGLKNWAHNRRPMSQPVAGTYELTSCSVNDGQAAFENCSMNGVVRAPGVEPTAVAHHCMAPSKRWPQPGQTLPVTVDALDPTLLKIEWKKLPTGRQQGQMMAQQLAAQARAQADGTSTGATGIQDGLAKLASLSPEAAAAVQAFTTAAGDHITVRTTVHGVVGDPNRPQPGQPGGGLSPQETAQAAADGGASLGLQPADSHLLAAHDVTIPPGTADTPPAGAADLTLDVTLRDGTGFTTTMRLAFGTPARRAFLCEVGRYLPVLVDPSQHDRVIIDKERLGPLPD
jgi:hypothetical protein